MSKSYSKSGHPTRNYEVRILVQLHTKDGTVAGEQVCDEDHTVLVEEFKAGEFVYENGAVTFFKDVIAQSRALVHLAGAHSDARKE